jgi:hypothetical protein
LVPRGAMKWNMKRKSGDKIGGKVVKKGKVVNKKEGRRKIKRKKF